MRLPYFNRDLDPQSGKLLADALGHQPGDFTPLHGIQPLQARRALDFLFQVEEPSQQDEVEGRYLTKMVCAHGLHNPLIDEVEAMQQGVTPQINGGHDKAPLPGFLTNKAQQERRARTGDATHVSDPRPPIVTELQVSPEASEGVVAADRDTSQSVGRDEAVPQRTNARTMCWQANWSLSIFA